MSSPNDPSDNLSLHADEAKILEELKAWLLKDIRRADALVEVMGRCLEEKKDEMSPEQIEEAKRLAREFQAEMAEFMVLKVYNPMVDRIEVLMAQDSFSQEEVEEVAKAEETLKELIDLALSMHEPRRTEAMTAMVGFQNDLRLFLEILKDA